VSEPGALRLEGKRAFVTGGMSGIGAATCDRFRDEGAAVCVADVADGADVHVDVASSESVMLGVEAAVGMLGGLDVVVCNAGKPVLGAVPELSDEEWHDGLAVNLDGVFFTARAAWPHLIESKGSILSTASAFGVWATGAQTGYCVAKAGVVMLTKCMAFDGARHGIRANCVCPGMVLTPMMEGILEQQPDTAAARAAAESFHPLRQLGRPEDIANAFVYLASDEARWVTGGVFSIDGGFTAGRDVEF
jgi:meso-butanediol dehydrogenase/(S,S)-butanediol dehydrogenase/diacetyl reductase